MGTKVRVLGITPESMSFSPCMGVGSLLRPKGLGWVSSIVARLGPRAWGPELKQGRPLDGGGSCLSCLELAPDPFFRLESPCVRTGMDTLLWMRGGCRTRGLRRGSWVRDLEPCRSPSPGCLAKLVIGWPMLRGLGASLSWILRCVLSSRLSSSGSGRGRGTAAAAVTVMAPSASEVEAAWPWESTSAGLRSLRPSVWAVLARLPLVWGLLGDVLEGRRIGGCQDIEEQH